MFKNYKFPSSFPIFAIAMAFLICGYPFGLAIMGWELGFFLGGVGVALLLFAVVKQFLDARS